MHLNYFGCDFSKIEMIQPSRSFLTFDCWSNKALFQNNYKQLTIFGGEHEAQIVLWGKARGSVILELIVPMGS